MRQYAYCDLCPYRRPRLTQQPQSHSVFLKHSGKLAGNNPFEGDSTPAEFPETDVHVSSDGSHGFLIPTKDQ